MGQFDFARDATPVFDGVARHLSGVGRRAASHDNHRVNPAQNIGGNAQFIQSQGPIRIQAIVQGLGYGPGLFADFFLHKGRKAFFRDPIRGEIHFEGTFSFGRVHGENLGCASVQNLVTGLVQHQHPSRGHHHDFVLPDFQGLLGARGES